MAERTTVLISGGGPAGMVLGLLLARAGIEVTVLEKHRDFRRDFRGNTVHASTLRLIDELGLGPQFRGLPQSRMGNIELHDGEGNLVTVGDFGRLPAPYDYVGMVPQWDLLALLAEHAGHEPSFTLRTETESIGLIRDGERTTGVRYRSHRDGAEGEIQADLTIVCEGRHSLLRRELSLPQREFPVPFDTWWFRLPRRPHEQSDIARLVPLIKGDEVLMTLYRDTYFQLAYLAPKGADVRLRAEGVESFRRRIARLRPDLADRVETIESMDEVLRLDVRLNRLRRWYADGVLCIGDAAHAMTPIGGVGINLAIQDAVATARLLAEPLWRGSLTVQDLRRVQRRRMYPTRIVQAVQRAMHPVLLVPAFRGQWTGAPPAVVFLARHFPALSALPARLIAYGPRAEPTPAFARRRAPQVERR